MVKERKKKVDVISKFPVTGTKIPIYGSVFNVELTYSDIRRCLLVNATVNEVLPNGNKIKLNLNNYMEKHEPVVLLKKTKPVKKEENTSIQTLVENKDTEVVVEEKEKTQDQKKIEQAKQHLENNINNSKNKNKK